MRDRLLELQRAYQPDEMMVTGMIHDHAARVRSFELAAEALSEMISVQEPA